MRRDTCVCLVETPRYKLKACICDCAGQTFLRKSETFLAGLHASSSEGYGLSRRLALINNPGLDWTRQVPTNLTGGRSPGRVTLAG
jgi:hypothetical protein